MSDEDAPQKQIPFDELEIVHVQSQDTVGNRRTRRSRWMSEFPAEDSALGARNNPQKQMLGCVGVNEFKCIHEPDLTSQLAAMWEVSHGGAPARCQSPPPLEDLASCQLRGLPVPVTVPLPLQPDFPDLLPRGHVGGCGSAKRPSSTQCFAICRCFHHQFRPAVDIFEQANRLRAIHSWFKYIVLLITVYNLNIYISQCYVITN